MSDAPISCMTSHPLCREYLVAQFGALTAQIQGDRDAQSISIRWGLGALANGELEVLGLWLGAGDDHSFRTQISADLRVAGVERIRFISDCEPYAGHADLEAPASPRLELRRPEGASLRRTIRLADREFLRIEASLNRLAKKRVGFATRDAAVLALTGTLDRAERQLTRTQTASTAKIRRGGLRLTRRLPQV